MKLLTSEWVSPPFDDSVEFQIRGMNGLEWYDFLSGGNAEAKGSRISINSDQARTVLKGVMDWRGVDDDAGPVEFSQAKWDLVGTKYTDWCVGEIIKRSTLEEDAEKN